MSPGDTSSGMATPANMAKMRMLRFDEEELKEDNPFSLKTSMGGLNKT
jgi:hypothetical protein